MKKYLISAVCIVTSLSIFGQENISYQVPSKEILELADFQRPPSVMMDSKRQTIILTYRNTYKSLDELNQEEMRLAGLRINPHTNISSTMTYFTNLKIRKINDKTERLISGLPMHPQIAYVSFSPDEKKLAFTNTTAKGVELYVVDIERAKATKVSENYLNANLGFPYTWYKDSKRLLVKVLPQHRPTLIDSTKDIPSGPIVSTATGKVSQNRTYQDLLKNPQDEANFETLAKSELHTVFIEGKSQPFKEAAIYASMSFSPDGEYLMLSTITRPYSYIVPLSRFPSETIVYQQDGTFLKEVNKVPLIEIMPKGFSSVRKGKRNMSWRSDAPATLQYVEALDEGDQNKKADFRDEVFTWEAPFTAPAKSFFKTQMRYAGVNWSNDHYAVISEQWYDTRTLKSHLINTQNGHSQVIEERNYQDVYSDPGDFNTTKNEYGRSVIDIRNGKAYLIGAGHTAQGQKPFVDELDMRTMKKKRVYQSRLNHAKEDIIDILDMSKGELLVIQQSAKEYPNYFKRNIKSGRASAVTQFSNPFASLGNVYKEVIRYTRKDGVQLSGTLYLPANYDRKSKKEKLPLLIWAYPTEYKDKDTAGQSTKNPHAFTYPSYGSFIYWVTKGYAVLDDAAFPIIGEGNKEPNDTFLEQLAANGKAAIDALDQLGYIDRNRVAVGGHSYGAFMTANLLTHTQDYACGIARSGAYNRTLTPFGFQSEQRNYWDVPQVYNTMSPFMNAHKMKTPMLLIHGDADNNSGTFTMQTERYFQALKNLGAPVRMVLLPKESHGYAAKESILHTLWEQDQFLEKCLKK